MKPRTLLWLVPLCGLGCLELPKSAPKAAAPPVTAQKPRTPPPVQPDNINEKNARARLEALQDELDRTTQETHDKPKEATQVTKAK